MRDKPKPVEFEVTMVGPAESRRSTTIHSEMFCDDLEFSFKAYKVEVTSPEEMGEFFLRLDLAVSHYKEYVQSKLVWSKRSEPDASSLGS